MILPTIPAPVAEALKRAESLGVLEEIGRAIIDMVSGNLVEARLSAETAAIRAAARAPYEIKK